MPDAQTMTWWQRLAQPLERQDYSRQEVEHIVSLVHPVVKEIVKEQNRA